MTHTSLVGTRVRHGNLVGTVTAVHADTVLVAPDDYPGSVVAIPIPAHLR